MPQVFLRCFANLFRYGVFDAESLIKERIRQFLLPQRALSGKDRFPLVIANSYQKISSHLPLLNLCTLDEFRDRFFVTSTDEASAGCNPFTKDITLSLSFPPFVKIIQHESFHSLFEGFLITALDEGVTLYLQEKIFGAEPPQTVSYQNYLALAKRLVEGAGEEAVIDAYFKGDYSPLKDFLGADGVELLELQEMSTIARKSPNWQDYGIEGDFISHIIDNRDNSEEKARIRNIFLIEILIRKPSVNGAELEQLVCNFHELINEDVKAEFKELQEAIKSGSATIEVAFRFFNKVSALPALRILSGGYSSRLNNGTYMDVLSHCKEVVVGLQKLGEGDYDYFNQRDEHREEGDKELGRDRFNQAVDIYKELIENPNDREILWFATALHDYGKILGGDHNSDGAKLAVDLLKALDIEEEKVKIISALIFCHSLIGNISLGERSPQSLISYMQDNDIENQAKFLKMLAVLNIADTNAVGEGWLSRKQLENKVFLSSIKNLNRLNDDFGVIRLAGLLGGDMIALTSKGDLDLELIKKNIPEIVGQEISQDEQDGFFGDFMRRMDFDYAFYLFSSMEPSNVVKWCYLNAQLVKLFPQIAMVRNTSDKKHQELDVILNDVTIAGIRRLFEEKDDDYRQLLEQGKSVDIFGLSVWLEANGRVLVNDIGSL